MLAYVGQILYRNQYNEQRYWHRPNNVISKFEWIFLWAHNQCTCTVYGVYGIDNCHCCCRCRCRCLAHLVLALFVFYEHPMHFLFEPEELMKFYLSFSLFPQTRHVMQEYVNTKTQFIWRWRRRKEKKRRREANFRRWFGLSFTCIILFDGAE